MASPLLNPELLAAPRLAARLKSDRLRRKVVRMRYIVWFGMSASIVFLAAVQSSSSKLGTTATVQNRETVQRLYGSPVSEVYRTAQDLMINSSFAPSGNLCRAQITSDVNARITDRQLDAVLNELVPEEVRGKYKLGTFLNITCLKSGELAVDPCRECSGVSEDYERVNITKYGNTNQYSSVEIAFHRPECKAG
jgi:hypothetical protein